MDWSFFFFSVVGLVVLEEPKSAGNNVWTFWPSRKHLAFVCIPAGCGTS